MSYSVVLKNRASETKSKDSSGLCPSATVEFVFSPVGLLCSHLAEKLTMC